jgi:hypothetical protein
MIHTNTQFKALQHHHTAVSKEMRAQTKKLITLCLDLNDKSELCFFANFHGHVNNVSIRVAKSAEAFNEAIRTDDFYFFDDSARWGIESAIQSMENQIAEIKKLITELKLLAKKHPITKTEKN